MNKNFEYILDKIESSEFLDFPFRHLVLENFLSANDFVKLCEDPQINFPKFSSVNQLFDHLFNCDYVIQKFPGCIESKEEYLEALLNNFSHTKTDLVEGFGMVFRISNYQNSFASELMEFLNSDPFKECLMKKFAIKRNVSIDTSIQKYLTGYEISPHPDIRSKALTYLVNINPFPNSDQMNIHTHLLSFKSQWKFIYKFWEKFSNLDRCWVPWGWCNTEKIIANNNSIIVFEPSNFSLHAVKLDYDHLDFQRTQIYGNLWYQDVPFELPMKAHSYFENYFIKLLSKVI